jgi:hypothetical protein
MIWGWSLGVRGGLKWVEQYKVNKYQGSASTVGSANGSAPDTSSVGHISLRISSPPPVTVYCCLCTRDYVGWRGCVLALGGLWAGCHERCAIFKIVHLGIQNTDSEGRTIQCWKGKAPPVYWQTSLSWNIFLKVYFVTKFAFLKSLLNSASFDTH